MIMTVIRLDIISELSFFRNRIKVAIRPKNIALIPQIIKIFICENNISHLLPSIGNAIEYDIIQLRKEINMFYFDNPSSLFRQSVVFNQKFNS